MMIKNRKFLAYLDANNLYGWAMSQYLSYSGSKWLNQKQTDKFDLNLIGENSYDGYILEADLRYPDELHDLQNDYPLVPEKPEIKYNMLSNYCSSITNKYDVKIVGGNKLVPNLAFLL